MVRRLGAGMGYTILRDEGWGIRRLGAAMMILRDEGWGIRRLGAAMMILRDEGWGIHKLGAGMGYTILRNVQHDKYDVKYGILFDARNCNIHP